MSTKYCIMLLIRNLFFVDNIYIKNIYLYVINIWKMKIKKQELSAETNKKILKLIKTS